MSLDVRRTRLSTIGKQETSCCSHSSVEQSYHRTSLLPPLSIFYLEVILIHIFSYFLIPLPDSSLICTEPTQSLVIVDTIIIITWHYIAYYITLHKKMIILNQYSKCCNRLRQI